MAVGEHIETVQKVASGRRQARPRAACHGGSELPLHPLRPVTSASGGGLASTTGRPRPSAGSAARSRSRTPETGKTILVTPERAVKEGIHHVQEVFGNLNRMSPFERQVAQSIMPFYGWQKHILGYVMSFPFDHPWRALVLSPAGVQRLTAGPPRLPHPDPAPVPHRRAGQVGQPGCALDIRSLDPFRDVANYGTC